MPIVAARFPGQRVRGPNDFNRLLSAFLVEHLNADQNYHRDKITLGDGTNNDDKGLIANNLSGQHRTCYRDSVGRWGAIVGSDFRAFAFVSELPGLTNDFLVHTNASGLVNALTTSSLTQTLYIQGASSTPVKIQIGRVRPGPLDDDTVCFPAGIDIGSPADGKIRHTASEGLTFTDILVGGPHELKDIIEAGDRSFVPSYKGAVEYDPATSTGTFSLVYNATDKKNYYTWTSGEVTLQNRFVVLRARIAGFHAWDAGLKLTYKTSNATGDSLINVTMLDTDGNAAGLTGGTGLANTSITTSTISVDSGTFNDGGYVTILLEMEAKDGGVVNMAELELVYY